jgi:hypothetical protein
MGRQAQPGLKLLLLGAALLLCPTPVRAAQPPDCVYDVAIEGASATALDVEVTCQASTGVHDFTLLDDSAMAWMKIEHRPPHGIFYRLDLDGFAGAEASYNSALRVGRSVMLSPESWILKPNSAGNLTLGFRFHVRDGAEIATTMTEENGFYFLASNEIAYDVPIAFGKFSRRNVALPQGSIDLVVLDRPMKAGLDSLAVWVADAARAVGEYWGRFPAHQAMLLVVPIDGSAIRYGRVESDHAIGVMAQIGADEKPRALYDEWVLVHEFTHIGSPFIRDTGAWLNEGIATYVEPIVRYRAGWRSKDSVWQEWLKNMPRGLQAMGPAGLRDASRGGVYWGGGLFMLLSDIAIHQATNNRMGLQDCLISVLNRGADIRTIWHTDAMLQACDAAVGGSVTRDLAAEHLGPGKSVDLQALWKELGVSMDGAGNIHYDDSAPLASVRESILSGEPSHPARPVPVGFAEGGN